MTATATLQADEKLALDLMGAIRAAAEELCAPSAVDLVSVTVDVSARIEDAGAATFAVSRSRLHWSLRIQLRDEARADD